MNLIEHRICFFFPPQSDRLTAEEGEGEGKEGGPLTLGGSTDEAGDVGDVQVGRVLRRRLPEAHYHQSGQACQVRPRRYERGMFIDILVLGSHECG